MGEVQRGLLTLALEPTAFRGRQLLLPETAIAGTLSLTTQPSAAGATVLMHLHIVVKGASATGTVTINGKKADGTTAAVDTSPTLPIATTEEPASEYSTVETFSTVDSSGVATTGLTGGTITIYGIIAGTKLVPATFDPEEQIEHYSTEDQRGLMYGVVRDLALTKGVSIDVESALYPDTDTFVGYVGFSNNPTVSTIPASPTTLLASTAVSGGPLSLTSQPTKPGQLLVITITGTSSNGTVTISGKNNIGQSAQETLIAIGGAGTYYTKTVFSEVNASGIAITGLSGGSLAVGAYWATKLIFLLPGSGGLATAALGAFSGTESAVYPLSIFESVTLDMDVKKENKLSAKIMAQDKVMLGNRATSPLSTSRLPVLGQPVDLPVVGWQTLAFIDPLSNAPFTTSYGDLISLKLQVETGMTPQYTARNSQSFDRVYQDAKKHIVTYEMTVDFRDAIEYEKFRKNVKRLFGAKFVGDFIGIDSGTLLYKSWSFVFPSRYQSWPLDRGDVSVIGKVAGQCEYEPALGYAARLEIINQAPFNYALVS